MMNIKEKNLSNNIWKKNMIVIHNQMQIIKLKRKKKQFTNWILSERNSNIDLLLNRELYKYYSNHFFKIFYKNINL